MSYRIVDEPAPSALERMTVNPVWPFLAAMFAGSWLAWPWFALNSVALGGGRRCYGDIAILLCGVLANVLAVGLLGAVYQRDHVLFRYALLGPQGVRLLLLYLVYVRQLRTFSLFEYFGGRGKNGLLFVVLGGLCKDQVLAQLPGLWVILLV